MNSPQNPQCVLEHALRIAKGEPGLASPLLATLEAHHPGLVARALQAAQDAPDLPDEAVHRDSHGVARIRGSVVAVWEVVRAFRKSGGVHGVLDVFAGLSEGEVRAALAYAGKHPDEIASQIQVFEDFRSQMSLRQQSSDSAVVLMAGS